MNKQEALATLARNRQEAQRSGYRNIGDYHGGAYECLHVSPYTKSAGNVDADIMVLLQDWTSDEFIRGPLGAGVVALGYTEGLPTNKNLSRLLREHFNVSLGETFATNLFPFIKPGDMGQRIPQRDLVQAGIEFALPQVRIIKPKLMICLGLQTYNAIRQSCGERCVSRLPEAINLPFTFEGTRIWCQAHTGGRGQAMRGKVKVAEDWRWMSDDLGFSRLSGPEIDLRRQAAWALACG